ncbi:MAG: hypothetical protein JW741_11035, partial [Sedimentisphaerales bacterium]|nr:hypothetical protein [Sedimentisphaerales bacterium]
LFLAVAADDPLAVDRTVERFTAYRQGKGSAELHVFQMGAHGFVNKGGGADHFMDRLEEWLVANKLLAKSPTALGLASKPVDDAPERRARHQPTVPSVYKEMPFVETAAEPALTPEEKQRGYALFHRPITEPVYPNTKPLAQERLEQLVAFATPGEFEPLTFSLYPVRDLQNLKVRCSSLTCEAGAIPTAAITVRLVTYWNVGYPWWLDQLITPGDRGKPPAVDTGVLQLGTTYMDLPFDDILRDGFCWAEYTLKIDDTARLRVAKAIMDVLERHTMSRLWRSPDPRAERFVLCPSDYRVVDYVRYWSERTGISYRRIVQWIGIPRSKFY